MTAAPSTTRFGVLACGPDRRLHGEAVVARLTLRQWAASGVDVVVLTDQPALYARGRSSVTWEGISAPSADAAERASAADDQMRTASNRFALEQLAYSIVCPACGPVRGASDCFIHDWANRGWFNRHSDLFLSSAPGEGLTPQAASERRRGHPSDGAMDGRLSPLHKRVKKLFRIGMDDDAGRIE